MQTRGCCSAASAKRLSVASPTEKPIRRGADASSRISRSRRLALWHRQPVEVSQQRSAELMEAAARQLHLDSTPTAGRDGASRRPSWTDSPATRFARRPHHRAGPRRGSCPTPRRSADESSASHSLRRPRSVARRPYLLQQPKPTSTMSNRQLASPPRRVHAMCGTAIVEADPASWEASVGRSSPSGNDPTGANDQRILRFENSLALVRVRCRVCARRSRGSPPCSGRAARSSLRELIQETW